MDDLKQKFLLLINKQNPQRYDDGEKPPDWMYRRKYVENDDESQRVAEDQEILNNIDKGYFVEESEFDSCRFELQKLPDKLVCENIQQERLKLCQQQKVVSKKVLQLILHKQSACSEEFERVVMVQDDVGVALKKAAEGRNWLGLARHNLTSASLGILANYKKRLALSSLLTALHAIKTLHQSEEKVQELLHGGTASSEGGCGRRASQGEGGDYVGAIRLLLECQAAASTFGHFTCVDALNVKLRDTLEMAEEQLDVALAKVCVNFDEAEYSRVQEAWQLVGKTQTAIDQMQMHFSSALHAKAAAALSSYLTKGGSLPLKDISSSKNMAPQDVESRDNHQINIHHMQYKELCKRIPPQEFLPCLTELCKSLWVIVRSYHHVVNWHRKGIKPGQQESHGEECNGGPEAVESELETNPESKTMDQDSAADCNGLYSNTYVMQKLDAGLTRIWNEVQSKICDFLLASDLSWYKFDDFLHILDIIHRLIEIGDEFCGSKSPDLQDSVRAKSLEYVSNHHRTTLDELRIFLENEGWEICPVRPSFSILQLREYRCLRSYFHSQGVGSGSENTTELLTVPTSRISASSGPQIGYFSKFSDTSTGSPFDATAFVDEGQDEDILMDKGEASVYWSDESDEDEDITEEMKRDLVDENAGEVTAGKGIGCTKKRFHRGGSFKGSNKPPFLTNTALTVLRLVGRYIRMACLLRPIAPDVIVRATHLYEYYLYTVFHFFVSQLPGSSDLTYSYKLEKLLERIRDKLILFNENERVNSQDNDKVHQAQLSPVVDLSKVENLHGLAERIAAAESVAFLSSQFLILQPYLEGLLSPPWQPQRAQGYHQHGTPLHAARHFLTQFYSQAVNVADELRRPTYMCVSRGAVNVPQLLNLMSQVNWEVPDVMSQHSSYVDILLRELQIFAMRMEEVGSRVPLPSSVHHILWQQVIKIVCDALVEGFANAGRHCSNGGRGLMQLDFTQFLSKVEGILGGSSGGANRGRGVQGGAWKSIVFGDNKEHVESYVKAFYQPEAGLEVWLKEHNQDYTQKQLMSLVSCVCQNSKKSRQRLMSLLEDMDRGGH